MRDDHERKRRFPRIASDHVALVSAAAEGEAEGFARTLTLGLGGCGFVTDTELEIGSDVNLLLSLGGRAIAARARVVYVTPRAERYDVGVEFSEIDAADLAFLKSRLPESEGEGA